jgi:hypothetical protein
MTRPESSEAVSYFIVSLEDMMKFETVELLHEFLIS